MKEFFGTTLPARLEKYEGLLKSRDEGKGFFLGAKVSMRDKYQRQCTTNWHLLSDAGAIRPTSNSQPFLRGGSFPPPQMPSFPPKYVVIITVYK